MTDHALLLVNLGSPASTSVADVRSYLNQFLMDPYVIDLPWPVRRLLVSLILIKRPEQSAHAYASIWWDEGSPLVVLSRRLQQQMTAQWTQGPVELAMRYGEPSIETVLTRLAAQGIRKVTLAPLYPQFADSTVTTVIEEAKRVVRDKKLDVQFSILQPFYDQPEYLDALVASARPYVEQNYDHLLLSFHGLPERHLTSSTLPASIASRMPTAARTRPTRCLRPAIARNASASPVILPRAWACRKINGRCRSNRAWAARSGSNPTPKRAWRHWPSKREKAAGDVPGVRGRLHRDAGGNRRSWA
ncbi:ferrochelatase domain-containing protein [Ditylenchus destructor]|nr:ferrochelatase domain-containing protein [Ditylenchus destructor]